MDWQLTAVGRTPWEAFRLTLPAGSVGVWSDIDGFHVGEPPATLDGATHLWVASMEASWRLRVDGTSIIGARLEHVTAGTGNADAEAVEVEPRQTPDDYLRTALARAAKLKALAVSGPAGEAWFVAMQE